MVFLFWGCDAEISKKEEPSITQKPYRDISCGSNHSCALDEEDKVDCWGLDLVGQASPPEGGYTVVRSGGYHTCAMLHNGLIECWGNDGISWWDCKCTSRQRATPITLD